MTCIIVLAPGFHPKIISVSEMKKANRKTHPRERNFFFPRRKLLKWKSSLRRFQLFFKNIFGKYFWKIFLRKKILLANNVLKIFQAWIRWVLLQWKLLNVINTNLINLVAQLHTARVVDGVKTQHFLTLYTVKLG